MATCPSDLATLLTNLVERVPGVGEAVVLSAEGQVVARSAGAADGGCDGLAPVAAGLLSAARGASRSMPTGGVYEIIVEFEWALIVVMGIPDGSTLAVSATRPYDIGVVAYEMALMSDQAGWRKSA